MSIFVSEKLVISHENKENVTNDIFVDKDLAKSISYDLEDDHNVFADDKTGPDFRGVSCLGGAALIAKAQFGVGVLGLPQTFDVLGFIPGLISIIGLLLLSTWAGFVMGKFRLAHPNIHNVGDAACLMFGKRVGDIFGYAFCLLYILLYSTALLTLSIAFNTFSGHSICTTGWIGVGAAMSLVAGLFTRTLKVISWCGYVAVVSILSGVWVITIACLVQDTPAMAPEGEPINKSIQVVATGTSYSAICAAVATQVLAICGTSSFFMIHAEMRDQAQYMKSVLLGQGFVAFNYIVVSCIVYAKVSQYIASPSLGTAGMYLQKVAYGIAFPGLFFGCFFQAHIAGKYALVRILKGTEHLQSNSKIHWITWLIVMILVIAIGFVVAAAIPFFDDLLGLIGSLLGTSFTLIMPGIMALHLLGTGLNEQTYGGLGWMKSTRAVWRKSKMNIFIVIVSFFAIGAGCYVCVSGAYGCIVNIIDGFADNSVSSAFSCEDNSG